MSRYISSRIRNRIDNSNNWNSINPILLSGEIGIELDNENQYLKVGDGSNNWNNLSYVKSKISDSVDYLDIPVILLPNQWNDNDEYVIDVGGGNTSYISNTSLQLIFPDTNISKEALSAAQKAMIIDIGEYTDTSITVKCLGIKPNIEIPIRIIIFR